MPSSIITRRSNLAVLRKRLAAVPIKDKKVVSYFTITVSLFALSFFVFFAIRPTLITALTLNKNVQELRKLNSDYEKKISNVITAQAEYEKMRDQLPLIDSALPSLSNFHLLASKLEEYAKRENVVINQLQIDAVPISRKTGVKNVQKYNFSAIAIGDYSSLSAYLSHIVNWKRIVTLGAIDFVKEGSSGSASLRVNIRGTTYYEP